MIVLTSYKAVEDIYGTICAIFIISMMIQKFIRSLRNLIFKFAYYML